MRALVVIIPMTDEEPIKDKEDLYHYIDERDVRRAVIIGEIRSPTPGIMVLHKNRYGDKGMYDTIGVLRSITNEDARQIPDEDKHPKQ